MKNLTPDITRKRLIVEGYFTSEVARTTIEEFFESLCTTLSLRKYGEPIIFSPGGDCGIPLRARILMRKKQ